MPTYANITPNPPISDGIPYATQVPLTVQEATLGDALKTDPIIAVVNGQTIVAVVKLTVNGLITGNNSYIVMQTDLGDGTWIDVAWIVSTLGQGTQTFVICGGGLGAMNNAFQQSRNSGQPPTPQAAGSNAVPLGGRVRFVGKATLISGSSSVAGTTPQVLTNITYKLQEPR